MKMLMSLVLAVGVAAFAIPSPVRAETTQEEKAAHPRIAQAIDDLEAAIQYMEAAPHDFGGHRAAAVQASRQALQQLRAALKYRAAVDTRKGK
jgi:hypothetical protein